MKSKVLFVDDEQDVLDSYKPILKSKYDVITSDNPEEAIKIAKNNGPFAVVVSDYRMPSMNGVELLSEIMNIDKNITRILLTGFSDFEAVIKAINCGNIYRYLSKPIVIEQLIKNIDDGIKLYNLIKSEKELLENTLKGSIKLLIDLTSVSNSKSFVRVSRVRNIVKKLATILKIEPLWEVEIAVMLSEIGLVGIPYDIIDRKERKKTLTDEELRIYDNYPKIGADLIRNIPRLENVAKSIENQSISNYNEIDTNTLQNDKTLIISQLIIVSKIYDKITEAGLSHSDAIMFLEKKKQYSHYILNLLDLEMSGEASLKNASVSSVYIKELKEDMILAEDIVDNFGMILYAKGKELTDLVILRLKSMASTRNIIEPIKVITI